MKKVLPDSSQHPQACENLRPPSPVPIQSKKEMIRNERPTFSEHYAELRSASEEPF